MIFLFYTHNSIIKIKIETLNPDILIFNGVI